jgi:hypothetical protein
MSVYGTPDNTGEEELYLEAFGNTYRSKVAPHELDEVCDRFTTHVWAEHPLPNIGI